MFSDYFWGAQSRNSEQSSNEVCKDSHAVGERSATQFSCTNTERKSGRNETKGKEHDKLNASQDLEVPERLYSKLPWKELGWTTCC